MSPKTDVKDFEFNIADIKKRANLFADSSNADDDNTNIDTNVKNETNVISSMDKCTTTVPLKQDETEKELKKKINRLNYKLKNASKKKRALLSVEELILLSNKDESITSKLDESVMDQRFRDFAFLFYPEGETKEDKRKDYQNFLIRLEKANVPAFAILHDKDYKIDDNTNQIVTNENGEPVEGKIHAHVMLHFDGKKSWEQVLNVVLQLDVVPHFEIVASRMAYALYLTHKKQHEKHQYENDEVTSLGGLNYDDYIINCDDYTAMCCEIEKIIDDNGLFLYTQIVKILRNDYMDYYKVVLKNANVRQHITQYLKAKKVEYRAEETHKMNASSLLDELEEALINGDVDKVHEIKLKLKRLATF